MSETKNIVESLLFASESPLSVDQLKSALPETPAAEIRRAASALVSEYAARKGGIILAEVAGGYQFRTRPDYSSYVHKLREPQPLKLSRAAMETLAIVAYQQPVLRSEIEHIRGVSSGNTLRFLQERKLIRILGRRDVPGRPLVYGTTKKFLETFDLKDLKDLPRPEELEDVPSSPQPGPPRYETADLPLESMRKDDEPAQDDGKSKSESEQEDESLS